MIVTWVYTKKSDFGGLLVAHTGHSFRPQESAFEVLVQPQLQFHRNQSPDVLPRSKWVRIPSRSTHGCILGQPQHRFIDRWSQACFHLDMCAAGLSSQLDLALLQRHFGSVSVERGMRMDSQWLPHASPQNAGVPGQHWLIWVYVFCC